MFGLDFHIKQNTFVVAVVVVNMMVIILLIFNVFVVNVI